MSGSRYLLDTNVVLGLLKNHGPAIELLGAAKNAEVFAYSCITRMELLGFQELTTDELGEIGKILEDLEYRPLTAAVEERVILLRQCHRVKLPDAIIVATALEAGYALLTLDERLARIFEEAIAASR